MTSYNQRKQDKLWRTVMQQSGSRLQRRKKASTTLGF